MTQTDEDACSLYVGNLNIHVTKDDLSKTFEDYKVVEIYIRVKAGSRSVYGFLKFGTEEAANKCKAECDGMLMKGRKMVLSKPQRNIRLIITHFKPHITLDYFHNWIKKYGPVNQNFTTIRNTGCQATVIVEFLNHLDANMAKQDINKNRTYPSDPRADWHLRLSNNLQENVIISVHFKYETSVEEKVVDEERVLGVFSSFGTVLDVVIKGSFVKKVGDTALKHGFGFVEFDDTCEGKAAALSAIRDLQGVLLDDVSFTVSASKPLIRAMLRDGDDITGYELAQAEQQQEQVAEPQTQTQEELVTPTATEEAPGVTTAGPESSATTSVVAVPSPPAAAAGEAAATTAVRPRRTGSMNPRKHPKVDVKASPHRRDFSNQCQTTYASTQQMGVQAAGSYPAYNQAYMQGYMEGRLSHNPTSASLSSSLPAQITMLHHHQQQQQMWASSPPVGVPFMPAGSSMQYVAPHFSQEGAGSAIVYAPITLAGPNAFANQMMFVVPTPFAGPMTYAGTPFPLPSAYGPASVGPVSGEVRKCSPRNSSWSHFPAASAVAGIHHPHTQEMRGPQYTTPHCSYGAAGAGADWQA